MMTAPVFHFRLWGRMLLGPAVLMAGLSLLPFRPIERSARTASPTPDEGSTRQVTVFGIRALPGQSKVDTALLDVAPQLRKLLPNHGFQLLGAENLRVAKGQDLSCDLGQQRRLVIDLRQHLTADGKVIVGIRLMQGQQRSPLFQTELSTPPNQLCFLEKQLGDEILLIGLGAR